MKQSYKVKHKRQAGRTVVMVLAAVAAMAAGALFFAFTSGQKPAFYIDPANRQQVSQGEKIYVQYCAVCHGAKLEGQPDWRTRLPNGRLPAPPHDESGHTWHHADSLLFDIVKRGLVAGQTAPPGHESDMPAYGTILSDEEIIAVLAYIKSTWPKDVQQMQQQVSRQYRH